MYVVRQLLHEGKLLVEDQTEGGQRVVSRDDLQGAWSSGALTFVSAREGKGLASDTRADADTDTAAVIADFHVVPEAERAEAWRRYTLIRPLLARPRGERTRRAIEQYLAREETGRQGQGTDGDEGAPTGPAAI